MNIDTRLTEKKIYLQQRRVFVSDTRTTKHVSYVPHALD